MGSPRTRRGQAALRDTLLSKSSRGTYAIPNWNSLAENLEQVSDTTGEATTSSAVEVSQDAFGAAAGVQRRLLRTTEGMAIRRLLYDMHGYEALHSLMLSGKTRPFRRRMVELLEKRLASWMRSRRKGSQTAD